MEGRQPKNSRAKLDANNRYAAKTYKKFTVNFKLAEFEELERYLQKKNIQSKNAFIIEAVKEKIERDNNINT